MLKQGKAVVESARLRLNGVDVEIIRKRIKHLYLRVCVPQGTVKVSAPLGVSAQEIEDFVVAKAGWIKKQQDKIERRKNSLVPEGCCATYCYFQGQQYRLRLVESRGSSRVVVSACGTVIEVHTGRLEMNWQEVLYRWYRQQLDRVIPPLVAQWEEHLQVRCDRIQIRKMKSRWGSCTPATARIRINLELATRDCACLEYVIVHELLHLVEPAHNHRFYALLDQHLPHWRQIRTQLNIPQPV